MPEKTAPENTAPEKSAADPTPTGPAQKAPTPKARTTKTQAPKAQAPKAQAGSALQERVRDLYQGQSRDAIRFGYGMLVFDMVTISFLIGTSFMDRSPVLGTLDAILGLIFALDLGARIWISRDRKRRFFSFYTFLDLLVIFSLLAPMNGEGAAFLRIARVFRVFRSRTTIRQLRKDLGFFRRNEEALLAAVNLLIFLFVMTGIVYETQRGPETNIHNYVDALYFTVASLTTTGFGDITMTTSWGRLLTVIIMIFGISFFLRLVQVMLRPAKVIHKCPACGLKRHDFDAVHCKACGHILNIEDDGAV